VRVAFLTQDLQLSGGVGVIVEHATQLSRHGFEVDLVLTRAPVRPEWAHRGAVEAIAFEEAMTRRYDVAVATWWETAHHVFELDAKRHAWFIQSLEDRFYPAGHPLRAAASLAQGLPLRLITEARWIAASLEALRPGERVLLVRNGIAKDVFAPPREVPIARGPLRILVEGSAHVPFKGVPEAVAATRAMREPRHLTVVAPDGSGALDGVDRAAGPVPQRELAELYADAHVVLKLSRVEGMFGPPLEGFHKGATCVVTPVTGHDEYVAHGINGLVVDFDDPAGTARALDLLARDRTLLHELRRGALETAKAWPSWEQQGVVMAGALRALLREPAPAALGEARRLARDFAGLLNDAEREAEAFERVSRLAASAQASRAYRAAVKGRTTVENAVRAPRRWHNKRRHGAL
jgi:glycosyltransferase involved in cell wall biosynthesis